MLSTEQQNIYDEIIKFIDGNENMLLLNASAGTGKTYLISYLVNTLSSKKICISTPTHKSKQVVISKLNEFGEIKQDIETIHKLLLYSGSIDEYGNKVFTQNKNIKINWKYDLIIIDECSMLSKNICNDIFKEINNNIKTKILFCGDSSQLNPIGEVVSDIFTKNIRELKLDTIIRAKNFDIMNFSKIHRLWQLNDKNIPMIGEHISDNIILFCDETLWLNDFIKLLKKGNTQNIILCWTNKQCNYYNSYIRKKIFNKTILEKYEIGEYLIFNGFHKICDNNEIIKFYQLDF